MKLKNRGFVATALLYGLLVVFIFLILGLLAMLQNRKMILDKLKSDIKNELNGMNEYKTYPDGTAIYYNPVTGKVCRDYTEDNSLNENKKGCMKWYIFNDNKNKSTVSMILDHNTTNAAAWNSSGSNEGGMNEVKTALDNDTKNWNVSSRLITPDEVAHIVGADNDDTLKWKSSKILGTDDINTKVANFYLNGSGNSYSTTDGWRKRVSTEKDTNEYAWLFDYTYNCESYGCHIESIDDNRGYWTSIAVNGHGGAAWFVYNNGSLDFANVVWGSENSQYNIGVRPVITLKKSDIYVPYKEDILNGADPVYRDNLVPVTINVENGTTVVKKADITEKWYSYKDKEWANAVVLKTNTKYEDNQEIPLSNIESYFVWIPKYSYKLFDLGEYNGATEGQPTTLGSNKKTIQIKFGTNTTDDSNNGECTTPLEAGTSGNCVVGDYMTHPAFITMNSNGLWVGKYETGYDGATTSNEAKQNSSDSTKVIIQPDVYSWRYINVKNAFTTSYNYLRKNDSHMMKNTEWGAVAYLSHSEYGINTEVNINNNSDYKTGYSAVDGTDQSSYPGTYGTDSTKTLTYNTTTGLKASTTGNITGIYDMSGGAWEYMASYRDDTLGSSGFTSSDAYLSSAYSKYFDVYPNDSSTTTYGKRILGDATGEIGPVYRYDNGNNGTFNHNNWYADISGFVESGNPWLERGGSYYDGVITGQFNFNEDIGCSYSSHGFRIVLTK